MQESIWPGTPTAQFMPLLLRPLLVTPAECLCIKIPLLYKHNHQAGFIVWGGSSVSVFQRIIPCTVLLPSSCLQPFLWWIRKTCRGLKMPIPFVEFNLPTRTKQHICEHCRTKIPQPEELIKSVEGMFQHFYFANDPNGVPVLKPSMLKAWRIQHFHMLQGCLSDPDVEGGILYSHRGTVQLNHVQGEGTKVCVWIPIRGTSQQEGYHFHQAQWVTGTHVSTVLFQVQGRTGVARWNYRRLVDWSNQVFTFQLSPALIADLNAVSKRVLGHKKYPAFQRDLTIWGPYLMH